jgi:hypothetical protein
VGVVPSIYFGCGARDLFEVDGHLQMSMAVEPNRQPATLSTEHDGTVCWPAEQLLVEQMQVLRGEVVSRQDVEQC